MANVTYVGNTNVKMVFIVDIDTDDIDTDASYIIMHRSDGSVINLSIDDVDSDNKAVIHYSKEDDFNDIGTYVVQPYIVLKDNGGKFLCDTEVFYVKGRINDE